MRQPLGDDGVSEKQESSFLEGILKSIFILVMSTGIGLLFWKLGLSEANIITVYILGVLLTSVLTSHQAYSLISSAVSVIVFNFFFTEPRYTLFAYDKDYPVTFIVMFTAALISGYLAVRLKKQTHELAMATLLAEKEQLRANLLRSISHDLRTPLTAISGNASNLLSNGERFDEGTKQQLYEDIYDDSIWLINLVENLLSITRIEDGQVTLHLSTELVDEVMAEALNHVNRKKKEHSIIVEAEDEILLARIDTRLMIQVFINIIDNAIKYTQPGSDIRITMKKENEKILVRIADNGPGISEEVKAHIFEMFYSGAKSIADSRRSLGLGLCLCKSIVDAHGGEIWVSDNKPHGAVFTLTLPMGEVNLDEQDIDISSRG